MRKCTNCGAVLAGGAVSFCPKCGKKQPKAKSNARRPRRCDGSARQGRPEQRRRRTLMDENYDGYYDDVQPIDAGRRSEVMDPEQLKQAGLVILGAVGMILLAIILMMLL